MEITKTEQALFRFSNRLTGLTGPLYIDTIKAVGWNGHTLPDAAIEGLHSAHQSGCRQTEHGLADMYTAIRQARTLARMMNG